MQLNKHKVNPDSVASRNEVALYQSRETHETKVAGIELSRDVRIRGIGCQK